MQHRLRLWVIDPSLRHAENQGVDEVLRGWSGTSRVFWPGSEPATGPGPETGWDTDGVVLLGSMASVHDPSDWIARLADWMRPLLSGERRIPVLGVCFGHQLIAHLARARVAFVDSGQDKRVGVEPSRLEGGRLLPGRHCLRVLVSHREVVKQAPADYRVTARRDSAPIDGLEHRELPVFSFQFHPEAREEFAMRAGLDTAVIDQRLREDGRRILAAFLEQVRAAARR
jgi:GMP synthase-like glutamine amidotransferase